MASNLSTIGFAFRDAEELRATIEELAAETVETLSTPAGDYDIWRSETGAEIWFHFAPADAGGVREITGLTPFFEGQSEIPMRIERLFQRPGDGVLEGAVKAWVAPDAGGDANYPIIFDAIDYAALGGRSLPFDCRVRIAGFAREVRSFADEEAYYASQAEDRKFAARSFFPIGMFASPDADGRGDPEQPASYALLAGTVIEHHVLTNERTRERFHWLTVESLAANYDVLADPSVVAGEIAEGATVEMSCWLVGRVLE